MSSSDSDENPFTRSKRTIRSPPKKTDNTTPADHTRSKSLEKNKPIPKPPARTKLNKQGSSSTDTKNVQATAVLNKPTIADKTNIFNPIPTTTQTSEEHIPQQPTTKEPSTTKTTLTGQHKQKSTSTDAVTEQTVNEPIPRPTTPEPFQTKNDAITILATKNKTDLINTIQTPTTTETSEERHQELTKITQTQKNTDTGKILTDKKEIPQPTKLNTPHNTEQTKDIMDKQTIQNEIASFVQEFSGEEPNVIRKANQLERFLGTADSIYNQLTSDEQRLIFDRLIMFRLTGDAYIKINRLGVSEYKKLKQTLKNIYEPTYSITELEKDLNSARQSYGESVRSYGYRLSEALEKYKKGYRSKYGLQEIDKTYEKHLNANAVETFKRGLNNVIIKEKIATSTASNIEDIILETERIDKMLGSVTREPVQPTMQDKRVPEVNHSQSQQNFSPNPITCNYCQRPGHTWSICRTRMNNEQRMYQTPRQNLYTQQRKPNYHQQNYHQQTLSYQQPKPNFNRAEPQFTQYRSANNNEQPTQRRYIESTQQQYNNNTPHMRYVPTHNTQFNPGVRQTNMNYRQPSQDVRQDRPPKYCSHCKTTKGHTFEECRSKFFGTRNYNTNKQHEPQQTPVNTNLEQQFSNMRINHITPQNQTQHSTQNYNSENSKGSNQA